MHDVLAINDLNFEGEVLDSDCPFVLAFGALWCPPCRALAPILERLAAECAGQARIGKTDVDEAPLVATRYRVRAVPTLVYFFRGRETTRHLGLTTREKMLALLASSAKIEWAADQ
jgi:thioredoxin 1